MNLESNITAVEHFPEYGVTAKELELFDAIANGHRDTGTLVKPETAQTTLKGLGYDTTTWERIVTEKIGSHETRSLAIIALGKQARVKSLIYANLRALDALAEGMDIHNSREAVDRVMQDPNCQTEALRTAILERLSER